MWHGQNRSIGYKIKWGILILIAVVAGIFVFGSVVMLLWNNILPAVFGIKTITFWQALGILVLSKILFGGFRGGHHRHHGPGHHWHGKYMQLSPEEREKMKAEWKHRCCDTSEKQE